MVQITKVLVDMNEDDTEKEDDNNIDKIDNDDDSSDSENVLTF